MIKLRSAEAVASVLVGLATWACAAGPPVGPGPRPDGWDTGQQRSEPAPSPRLVRPGPPGEPGKVVGAPDLSGTSSLPHTPADVEFMQGMIPHHAQALDMAALVEEGTESRDIRLLARRIEISQRDEIHLMSRWLEERGEAVPGAHAHHRMGHHLMPGMLSPEEMDQLAAARGPEFDRLFLEFMIKHHEGALVMVEALFASPGAGQETDIFTFASHVETDQVMEIRRMRQMLAHRP